MINDYMMNVYMTKFSKFTISYFMTKIYKHDYDMLKFNDYMIMMYVIN